MPARAQASKHRRFPHSVAKPEVTADADPQPTPLDRDPAGALPLATEPVTSICGRLGPRRRVDLVCDGAYARKALRHLPRQVTVTTRLRADAALYQLPAPRRPGQRGRTPSKGPSLPDLHRLAGMTSTRSRW